MFCKHHIQTIKLRIEYEEFEKTIKTPESCLTEYDSEEEREDIAHEIECYKIIEDKEQYLLKWN